MEEKEDRECDGCSLINTEAEECNECMGFLETFKPDQLPNPFDFVEIEVFGATKDEVEALKTRYQDIVNKAWERGRLPKNPTQLQIALVRILKAVLDDHYNTYF